MNMRKAEVTTWGAVAILAVVGLLLTGEPIVALAVGAGYALFFD